MLLFFSNHNIFPCVQTGRRVLGTDEWLRVLGCDGVYALGDSGTINQRKVMVCKVKWLPSHI